MIEAGFPLGLENLGKAFSSRGKSGNFEQVGKVSEKSSKIKQNTGNSGNFRQILIVIFSDI